MSKDNNSKIAEIIDSASTAVQQNVPQTIKESDGVLSTVVGFFNNVVLYPVKKANLTFRYKLEAFEKDLREKTKHIPNENLQVPPVMIAGPTLEALRYTYDEAELREMYENLLASAMDTTKVSKVHPSFVDTIKQMSPLDAKILQEISRYQQLKCFRIQFCYEQNGNKRVYTYGMPDYYVIELNGISDNFNISSALINLRRLGVIVITNGTLHDSDYSVIYNDSYYQSRLSQFKAINPTCNAEIKNETIELDNYGLDFIKACLKQEGASNAD